MKFVKIKTRPIPGAPGDSQNFIPTVHRKVDCLSDFWGLWIGRDPRGRIYVLPSAEWHLEDFSGRGISLSLREVQEVLGALDPQDLDCDSADAVAEINLKGLQAHHETWVWARLGEILWEYAQRVYNDKGEE